MVATEYEVCPNQGQVVLAYCGGAQCIVHLGTCESQPCPPNVAPWRFAFDDEGSGFLRSGSEGQHWVGDLLSLTMCKAAGSSEVMVAGVAPTGVVPYDEWRHSMKVGLSARVPFHPAGEGTIEVVKYQVPFLGFSVGWDIAGVHRALKLSSQGGKPGKWVNHGWARWCKFASCALGLGDQRTQARVRCKDIREVGDRMATAVRGMEFKMVSTHVLLGLLIRWSGCHPTMSLRSDKDKACVRCMLMGLRHASAPRAGTSAWTLFLDLQVEWKSPAPPTGERPCTIFADGWIMDLRPLFKSSAAFAMSIGGALGGLCDSEGKVCAFNVLLRFAALPISDSKHWFFVQLLWFVGRRLDSFIAPDESQLIGELSERSSDKALARYWMACTRAFARPSHLHVSLDAPTILKKPMVVGVMAMPGNVAATFPPQAARVGGVLGNL